MILINLVLTPTMLFINRLLGLQKPPSGGFFLFALFKQSLISKYF
jgi:hypothetical protein